MQELASYKDNSGEEICLFEHEDSFAVTQTANDGDKTVDFKLFTSSVDAKGYFVNRVSQQIC